MVNQRGQTIPSVHPALVPHQGTMAGNVLVLGVVAVLEAMCHCQDTRPGVGLIPTMGHTVVADRAHQATKQASTDEQI